MWKLSKILNGIGFWLLRKIIGYEDFRREEMSEYTIYRQGDVRGEKIQYPNHIGYRIWTIDNPIGFETSFDLFSKDIDDLIGLLQQLKIANPNLFGEDEVDTV